MSVYYNVRRMMAQESDGTRDELAQQPSPPTTYGTTLDKGVTKYKTIRNEIEKLGTDIADLTTKIARAMTSADRFKVRSVGREIETIRGKLTNLLEEISE